ncbi:MAG: GGDEF domain-containing protein [Nanoarchaeota archaeon]
MEKESERLGRITPLEEIIDRFKHELQKSDPDKGKLDILFRELHSFATTDNLTSLINYLSLKYILEKEEARALRTKNPISGIVIDLDGFKRYNDNYGHEQGNEALRTTALVLVNNTRKSDYCARFGGEELFVALPETNLEIARSIAERIRYGIENVDIKPHTPLREGYNKITASLGVTTMDFEYVRTAQELCAYADRALYEAKRKGKNRVEVYSPELVEVTSKS